MLLAHSYRALCAIALLGALAGSAAAADRIEPTPQELEEVDVAEKLGASIPLSTEFVDADGKRVRLADVIGSRPVILTFNYSNCPMLCNVQLGGLVNTMSQMDWNIGSHFDVITISLDPSETRERATETRDRYIEQYGRDGAFENWTFLTGTKEAVDAVTNSVGFGYTYHEGRKEYLHPAVLTLVSPRGKVSTYIYGVSYDPIDLRDKLLLAGIGETSEAAAKFILSCYHYDAPTGNGAIVANIMRYGGLVFVFGFAGAIALVRRRRHLEDLHSEGLHPHAHQVGSTEDHV
jgi:protein SCO1/2